ncbi:MAG: hypothetical protein WB770_00040 [Acidimicrobiales bacterium]
MTTGEDRPPRRIVAVLPDVTGIDRTFVYAVPDAITGAIAIGVIARIPLQGRIVRGWVVEEGGNVASSLREVDKFVSLGPSARVVELCRLSAWRYAGRLRPFLHAASPPRLVRALPPPTRSDASAVLDEINPDVAAATKEALGPGRVVLRIPPSAPRLDVVRVAIANVAPRDLLVLVPERHDVDLLTRLLARLGVSVAIHPDQWTQCAAGGRVVVGTRSGVFAPMPHLGGIVVLDSHAEAYAEQRAPTWNATTIARLRAEQEEVPCLLVSACPPVAQLDGSRLVAFGRDAERAGWARVVVFDRRGDDPRSGLFSSRLAEVIREARGERPSRPFVCVLNRKGRARLLRCARCDEIARCERCGAAVHERRGDAVSTSELVCDVCGTARPVICLNCSSTKLARRRLGTERVAEELAALIGEPVLEVTGERSGPDVDGYGVLVGTEAVLHRVRAASSACFLDFDQELLAPRYRAFEEALALIARASRLVGGRGPDGGGEGGNVFVQTRLAHHEVLQAAVHGDPAILSANEKERRASLGLPPAKALALLEGDETKSIAEFLSSERIEIGELPDGRVLARATSAADLSDALAKAGLPREGLRVAVDPLRL